MNKIKYNKKDFFANYFWSIKNGSLIDEDILVKTYLSNYFSFKDFFTLYKLVGENKLLKYAKEINCYKRVKNLIQILKNYQKD
jgi:hypothetical protein